jgi:hypothetical protein
LEELLLESVSGSKDLAALTVVSIELAFSKAGERETLVAHLSKAW